MLTHPVAQVVYHELCNRDPAAVAEVLGRYIAECMGQRCNARVCAEDVRKYLTVTLAESELELLPVE